MTPQTFRKKPVEIEAQQYDGTTSSATSIIDWALSAGGTITYHCNDGAACRLNSHSLSVRTLEGTMIGTAGDWIIRGVQGEFYPCKPDIFERTYTGVGSDGTEEHAEHTVYALRLPNGVVTCRARVSPVAESGKRASVLDDLKRRAEGKTDDANRLGVTDYAVEIVSAPELVTISTGPWTALGLEAL